MNSAVRILPANYVPSGTVSLKKTFDLTAMVIWSLVLLVLSGLLVGAVLAIMNSNGSSTPVSFSISSPVDLLMGLGGLLLVTFVMVIVHEGLHGVVFWLITRERPKFTFKWYYASASAEGWYLPRMPYLAATLMPLVVITTAGLAVIPFITGFLQILVILLVVFNASGCAGDAVVAWRLYRLPPGTLSLDSGDEVHFYTPSQDTG